VLEAVPNSLFSKDYIIRSATGALLVELHRDWFRKEGQITIEGVVYRIYREGTAGAFILEANGEVIARASKSSNWMRSFDIDYQGIRYMLKSKSVAWREFVLRIGLDVIGTIRPKSAWSRKAVVDLPDFSLPIAIFITWLVIIMWQQEDVVAVSA
jgi:hypothetical protein